MTTYLTITDAEIAPDAPLTTSLMRRLRDNLLAVTEGDASAPYIPPRTWTFVVGSASPVLNIANASAVALRLKVSGTGGGCGGATGGHDWFGNDAAIPGSSGAHGEAVITIPAGGNADFYVGLGGARNTGASAPPTAGGDTKVIVSDASGCNFKGGPNGPDGVTAPTAPSPTVAGSAVLLYGYVGVTGVTSGAATRPPPGNVLPASGSGGKGSTGSGDNLSGLDGYIYLEVLHG